jgi:outer membrane biogenesis lipoprotein LolB
LGIAAIAGCVSVPPPPPVVGPVREPAEALHVLSSRAQDLRDLRARARISLRIDGVRQSATAILFYRSPDALKLDLNGPLGVGVLSALARRDSLAVYLPRDNRYLEGQAEEVLYRITGVDLSYYDVCKAILGLPNLSPLDLPRTHRFEQRDARLFLEVRGPLWTRHVWLDPHTMTLSEEEVYDPEGFLLSKRLLKDYREENGVVLPRHIEIRQGEDRIEIQIVRRTVNQGRLDGRFRLKIPSNVVRMDGEG